MISVVSEQYGIQASYQAASGETVYASEAAVRAIVEALGEPERPEPRMMEPVMVAWDGRIIDFALRLPASAAGHEIGYEIHLEDGVVISGTITPNPARIEASVPLGYHTLIVHADGAQASALLIAAPRRGYSGDRRREWGVFAPLYAIRESNDKPIGDFGDLEALMRFVGEMDGDLVATLPISAAFLSDPFDPSPYSPASRLFWNELYLSTEMETGTGTGRLIDYKELAQAKRAALQPVASAFFAADGRASDRYRGFIAIYPDAEDYARFRAAGEHFTSGWPVWPEAARNGKLTPADYEEAACEYHLYAQMCAHEQLRDIAATSRTGHVRLYLDMPLGVHPDSYDVWRNRDLFITGASAGAPPDPFFTRGQNWGFPPMNPLTMRERHYAYWRQVIQTQLRYAGILRLDHVMSLHRLYLVPNGFEATDGVYITYPAEELYAVLTLESIRHQSAIIGEDLGTVPPEVRGKMEEHGIKRMFVLQFEAGEDPGHPCADPPRNSVASLNTHDMPMFNAWWHAKDADLRGELGLLDDNGVHHARSVRRNITHGLSLMLGAQREMPAAEARTALLRFLARSPADMVLVNLEDLWLEDDPQNIPGTSQERPNWRRRMKHTLEEIRADPLVRELLAIVENERRKPETNS